MVPTSCQPSIADTCVCVICVKDDVSDFQVQRPTHFLVGSTMNDGAPQPLLTTPAAVSPDTKQSLVDVRHCLDEAKEQAQLGINDVLV